MLQGYNSFTIYRLRNEPSRPATEISAGGQDLSGQRSVTLHIQILSEVYVGQRFACMNAVSSSFPQMTKHPSFLPEMTFPP